MEGERKKEKKKENGRGSSRLFFPADRISVISFPTSHHYNQASIMSINQAVNTALLPDVFQGGFFFTFSMP